MQKPFLLIKPILLLRYILLIIVSCSSLCCTAQYGNLVHKSYAERYQQIDSIFYYNELLRANKQAFYKEVNALEKEAIAAADIELQCEAKLLMLADYSTDDNWDSAKVESYAKALCTMAQENELTQIEIRCRQFMGRYYMEKKGQYIKSIDQFLQSYYLLGKLSPEEFPSKKESIYNVAHAYYTFGDFNGAKKYLNEAEDIKMPVRKTMLDNPYKINTYISLKNTLGLIYRNEQQYDSARYFFEMVRSLAETAKDTTWMGIASGNIGICYYLEGKYDQAIPFLQVDIESSFKGGQIDNGLNSLTKLAEIYLLKNDMNTVRLLLDSARHQLNFAFEPSEIMQNLAVIMARYYSATGNMALAYKYMDTAMTAKQIINDKKNAMQLVSQQHKLDLQAHQTDLEKVENIKRLQILKRNGIILLLLLFTIFAIIIIYSRSKVYQQKTRLAEAEKNRAELDLLNAEKQLQEFTMRIAEKNELIMKFTDEISHNKSSTPDNDLVDIETIQELQQFTLLTDEQWEEFKIKFDQVHHGFLTRLKEKLPGLTAAEIRFMTLYKLKLNNKEMSQILGIGLSGIRNYKHRLRKKLQIEDDSDFDHFIECI